MSADEVRAEYARLSTVRDARLALYNLTVERHKQEFELVYADLIAASSARDRFAKEHPEVLP